MKILLNCLHDLDKQVKEFYILAQSSNEKYIKSEKHTLDLTECINFITKKLADYEKDRTEKKKLIKDLTGQVSSLENEHEQLKSDVEKIFVHGIPKEQGKSADSIVLNAINKHLEEGLTEVDIQRNHRVGKPKFLN